MTTPAREGGTRCRRGGQCDYRAAGIGLGAVTATVDAGGDDRTSTRACFGDGERVGCGGQEVKGSGASLGRIGVL